MAFTTLSLLVSFFSQVSRLSQLQNKRQKKFLNNDRATFRMTIRCGELKAHHAFAYQKIEQSIGDVVDTDEHLADLHHRNDVSVTTEVYDIKAKIKTKHSLIIIFECLILTQELTESQDSERALILETIKNIGINKHPNNKEMTHVCNTYVCLFVFPFFVHYVIPYL